MASWLKAACLPKVVDRRGKSVVEDLSEEQSDLHLPASNKKGSQAKRLKVQRESRRCLPLEIQPTDTDVQSVLSLPQSVADTKSEDAAVVAIGSVALLSQLQMTSKLMELFQMTLWCNRCNRKPGQGTVIQSTGNEAFVLDCLQKIKEENAQLEESLTAEVECTSLDQELQDMEVRARRGQTKSPDEPNQVTHIQAWQGEVDSARQAQRDAEKKLASMEA
ncbi:hypothetical protein HID58_024630 [Brassica napus]|uniref:Uncharacterized protein n=1 Tax=Brassica napus TaxID=3708 RepID=A0ABQ8CIQ1_BRANA|nr:hypothetical protein HID58_024630 [Brassica napus]